MKKIITTSLIALLLCSYGFAQKKTFIRDYIYQASENDSRNTARKAAVQEMQALLLMEIGQALQSEQTLQRLSVAKDGKETFSESFSQEVMAITAGFVEMKILNEAWNGKTYYIEAQMTVDPKEVSQRVAETLNSKQKEKEGDKAEQAKTDVEKRVQELEAQKKEIEARKKEMALKHELARLKDVEARELEKLEKKSAKEKAKAGILYQPKAFGIGVGLGYGIEGSVSYTRNISPNFGCVIFKLNGGTTNPDDMSYLQLLTGPRFATNCFGRNKNTYFYTSVKAGVGFFHYWEHVYNYGYRYDYHYFGLAFAAELEAGIHFKYFFLGLAVNHGFFKPKLNYRHNDDNTQPGEMGVFDRPPFIGLRLGWDIGKRVSY
jgi:hypothetical protein